MGKGISEHLGAKIIELYRQGKTDKQVADLVGVSVRSIHYWKKKYPEFLQSIKEAKNILSQSFAKMRDIPHHLKNKLKWFNLEWVKNQQGSCSAHADMERLTMW